MRDLDNYLGGCNCPRKMPYMDFSHDKTCPLYSPIVPEVDSIEPAAEELIQELVSIVGKMQTAHCNLAEGLGRGGESLGKALGESDKVHAESHHIIARAEEYRKGIKK